MFAIVHNNQVIWGPKDWHKRTFEEVLLDDLEIQYTLETRNESNLPVVIDENTKILPVVSLLEPEFNSKIQRLDGPFWNFYEDRAEMYYGVADLPVEAVKNQLKAKLADLRWKKEVEGVKTTVQGTEVFIDTMRGSRDIFFDTFLSMGDQDTVQWKFPEGWKTINKAELGAIVTAGKTHIQNAFIWEATKTAEIDACTTLQELDAITELEEPQPNPPWIPE